MSSYSTLHPPGSPSDWKIEARIQRWNWKSTPEERFCRNSQTLHSSSSKELIPNVVHFVLLAEEGQQAELDYARFLAIKAAIIRMDAREIKLHTYGLNNANQWWPKLKNHVTLVTLNRNKIYAPYNHPISHLDLPGPSPIRHDPPGHPPP
ncbi:hypothetical protein Slin15195_G122190 [Septoria linicola]|uniref:Uncharacterized protein n=1 Tax=Septoria linicola TaxID=215465 RepID=A0A9Q9B630_9PEZI|nr:hypothetical protein Slin14017_G078400 [Septoria linicola]USW58900.1 hypothetical protein Slin15195_G122190 [Septoria linicola]